jgi:hypothetical protein
MKEKRSVTGGSNMNAKLRNGMLALALLGDAALFAASALASDMNEGDFGGTYRYIGPGRRLRSRYQMSVAPRRVMSQTCQLQT